MNQFHSTSIASGGDKINHRRLFRSEAVKRRKTDDEPDIDLDEASNTLLIYDYLPNPHVPAGSSNDVRLLCTLFLPPRAYLDPRNNHGCPRGVVETSVPTRL
jgi:hypothetical protein